MADRPDSRAGAAISLRGATLERGGRTLWRSLDLDVEPGEFLVVLGPNGAGKTTLLRVLLGLLPLTSGRSLLAGDPVRRGSSRVGYVPQQKGFDAGLSARGRELVTFGATGHRYGRPWPRRDVRRRVDAAIEAVGAGAYADAPIGRLSGGEQQRLRIAQALISDPLVLLCDEPLLSLDLHHQRAVLELIDRHRRDTGAAVVMVTHEINPVLPIVDRVLYLVDGQWAVGTPDEVLTSEQLSALYGSQIDVIRTRGRIVVVGAPDSVAGHPSGGDTLHRHPMVPIDTASAWR